MKQVKNRSNFAQFRTFFSLLLLMALLLCLFAPGLPVSAELIPDGYWGDIYWCFENSCLSLQGEGRLPSPGEIVNGEKLENEYPWDYYRGHIKEIRIDDGIVNIPPRAFANCTRIKSLTIPAHIETIGYGAFEHCGLLETVTLPEGLKQIGSGAFYCCLSLTDLTLPGSLESIGEQAFFGCASLREVTAAAGGALRIDRGAFSACKKLDRFSLSAAYRSSVTLGAAVFEEDYHLEGLYFSMRQQPEGWDPDWKSHCSAPVHWNAVPVYDNAKPTENLPQNLSASVDTADGWQTTVAAVLVGVILLGEGVALVCCLVRKQASAAKKRAKKALS